MAMREGPIFLCDLCGKTQFEVKKIIASDRQGAVCDACVDLCVLILREGVPKMTAADIGLPPSPGGE